jgi:hypothetical protein
MNAGKVQEADPVAPLTVEQADERPATHKEKIMRNTLRALVLAVPMAASIGVGGVAFAETPQQQPTFDLVLPADHQPGHDGPGDFDGPVDEPGPDGPGDIDGPVDGPGPDGPGDLDGPKPDHDDDGDHDDDDGDHDDDDGDGDGDGDDNGGHPVRRPSRIDAGDANQGPGLALILAGGAVVATGGAFAARRMARN